MTRWVSVFQGGRNFFTKKRDLETVKKGLLGTILQRKKDFLGLAFQRKETLRDNSLKKGLLETIFFKRKGDFVTFCSYERDLLSI